MSNHSPNFRLDGNVAVVTGASRGIGRALATGLANAGANIVGVATSNLDDTAESVRATGARFLPLRQDIGAPDAADSIIRATTEHFGRVDVLVNNAGIIRREAALDFDESDWDDVMNVNLRAAFLLAQAAARRFQAQQSPGKILNVASLLSFQGGIRVASYTASKSGLAGLTRLLANEWAPLSINVNAIAPGYIETDNTELLRSDPARYKSILERIPAGRWGRPDDMVGAAVFLCSQAANYIHGTTLAVDGGWLAR